MKKFSILLALTGAFVFGQITDLQVTSPTAPTNSTEGTDDVILDQPTDDALTTGIVSTYFGEWDEGVYCADDFDMPFNGKLTSVSGYGFNLLGNFMADTTSVRFFILADDGGFWIPEGTDPETEYLYKFDVPLDDPALEISIDAVELGITLDFNVLGEDVFLEEGEKYWLSIVPVMHGTGGAGELRWNWYLAFMGEGSSGEAVIIDPGDLFEEGLTNWTPFSMMGFDTSSLAMRVEAEETLGLNDLSQEANFVVYPNPTVNFIKVKTFNADVKEITVYSIDGKQVASANTDTVRVTSLPSGVYVVKVMDTNGKVHTQKILKK